MNSGDIDVLLDRAFTQANLTQAFFNYKLDKWDHFSRQDNPEIFIPMGADGVTYQAFENQLERHVNNISHRIRNSSYIFYPFREVDKKKDLAKPLEGNNIRTLGIASIRDALVQSILYEEILYKPIETLFCTLDNPRPVSFAYRKGKSPAKAAQAIYEYAHQGYWHVYDADLSAYFDSIPHVKLLEKLASILDGDASRAYKLVSRFVRTDRVPYHTYVNAKRKGKRIGHKIFLWQKPKRFMPKKSKGVPQGGKLSGLLANLYLHEFDEWVINDLGKRIDLKYVRYADDFVIMVKNPELLPIIDSEVIKTIESEQFKLNINRSKTQSIDIRNKKGLDFVGFNFDKKYLRVREKSINKFKIRIKEEIFEKIPDEILDKNIPSRTLGWLIRRINRKIQGLRGEEKCPQCQCNRIGTPRSWMAAFQIITDMRQLQGLDKWLRQLLYSYMHQEYGARIQLNKLKKSDKLLSLVKEVYKVRDSTKLPCLCDIKNSGKSIWAFADDFWRGKSFITLAKQQPFSVPYIDENNLQVSIKGRQYLISKITMENLWERLKNGEIILRSELDNLNIRNTSQIVALLAKLPGIHASSNPISLGYREDPPAGFLVKTI